MSLKENDVYWEHLREAIEEAMAEQERQMEKVTALLKRAIDSTAERNRAMERMLADYKSIEETLTRIKRYEMFGSPNKQPKNI